MSKTNITNTIDLFTVVRDAYKSKYKQHLIQYKERLKDIETNYKSNSPFYKQEKQRAKEEFELAVEKERKEAKEFIGEAVEQLRQDEVFHVRQIDVETMQKLNAISDMPLSAEELSVLQKRFAPHGEYWATRKLAVLAEKNGLKPSQFENSASLHTKLDILSQLEGQLDKLLSDYNGEQHYRTEVLLCDSVLQRAERTYCNGWQNADMEDEAVARRAFVQLKGLTPIEQGIALQNLFNNTTKELKNAIFFEMANHEGIVETAAIRWAGLEAEFEAYKSGQYKDYEIARKAIDKVRIAEGKVAVEKIAEPLKENPYFMDMLNRESDSNMNVGAYLREVDVESSKTNGEVQVAE